MTRVTRFVRRRSRVVQIGAVVAIGLISGALAYWAGTGAGTVTATLDSPEQTTLSEGTPLGQLYPGDDASVAVIATNPNPYIIVIQSLTLDTDAGTGGFDVDSGHSGCDTSVIHFVPHGPPWGIFGPGWRVPPRIGAVDGTLNIDLGAALTMETGADQDCQSATFTVHLLAGF
jgi:hypothetical protein